MIFRLRQVLAIADSFITIELNIAGFHSHDYRTCTWLSISIPWPFLGCFSGH